MNTTKIILLSLLLATSAHADAVDDIIHNGRRELHEMSLRHRQEFQNICNRARMSGAFGCGQPMAAPMQPPPATQFVALANTALLADMDPASRNQFEMTTRTFPLRAGGNLQAYIMLLQNAGVAFDNQPGDDNKRAALVCYLLTMSFRGMQPTQIAMALKDIAQQQDAAGARWHRQGNFGAFLSQF